MVGGDRAGGGRVDESAPVKVSYATVDVDALRRFGSDPGGGGRGIFFGADLITSLTLS